MGQSRQQERSANDIRDAERNRLPHPAAIVLALDVEPILARR